MKRYHTETERIANEAFNRAILGGSKFYVNGKEWHPSLDEEGMLERFEASAMREQGWALPDEPDAPKGIHVATEKGQEEFWANLPQGLRPPIFAERRGFWACIPRVQNGLGRAKVDWVGVWVLSTVIMATMGVSALLVLGLIELLKAFRG